MRDMKLAELESLPVGSYIRVYYSVEDAEYDILAKTDEGWFDTEFEFIVSPAVLETAERITLL